MAVRLNLLPYRRIRRAERQREFTMMLAGAAAAAVAVVFLGWQYMDSRISSQNERNTRLQTAIGDLDKQIAEIKDLKQKIAAVLERKRVVEDLQNGRGRAVNLLDELARKLPEGIYLKAIRQRGKVITLDGVADTDARVAALVRNINESQYLEAPELAEIHAIVVNNMRRSAFTMSVKQKDQEQKSAQAGQ
ncbi:MAG: PilN domain-containing protein [Methylobacillus sp.]|jgi:type IV pilus assembly protein PilN|nr:PilN domain-containing protein [Methylobacillus sp.]